MFRQIKRWIEESRFRRTFVAAESTSRENTSTNWQEIKIETLEGNRHLREQINELRETRQQMVKEGFYVNVLNVTIAIWFTRYLLFCYRAKNNK
jgi:hypothetical protein